MFKLSLAMYIIVAPVLMGVLVLTVLTVPSLVTQDTKLILPAAGAGAALGLPIAYIVAFKLNSLLKKK
jgi:nitrogen fixation/metabolism regulation signal transduction histidine kinase